MEISALGLSDVKQVRKQMLSLQDSCLSCIAHHLYDYPTEHLSLLPMKLRKKLLLSLPPLDVIHLEETSVMNNINLNNIWEEISYLYAEAKDCRVLPRTFKYSESSGANVKFYDTLKENWRTLYLTRTMHLLLHRFNPSTLAVKVAHRRSCKYPSRRFMICDCWGKGHDPLGQDLFWRLIALPFRSGIAHYYAHTEHGTSRFKIIQYYQQYRSHGCFPRPSFQPNLIIPLRYASYLTDGAKIDTLGFFKNLSITCQFKPKVLSINCVLMYYSEFYQEFLSKGDNIQAQNNAWTLLVNLLSELECLELWWPSVEPPQNQRSKSKASEPVPDTNSLISCISKTILRAIFETPSPKLVALCLRTSGFPTLDDCLTDIAPFFSTGYSTQAIKSKEFSITPYSGLKSICISTSKVRTRVKTLSAVVLHQSDLEHLEISARDTLGPGSIMDPIHNVLSGLQCFVFEGPWSANYDYENVFRSFLENNPIFEICATVDCHTVTIPASCLPPCKKTFEMYSNNSERQFDGIIFRWLQGAKLNMPLKLIETNGTINDTHLDSLSHCLSSCEALEWRGTYGNTDKIKTHFSKTCNKTLQSLAIASCYPIQVAKLLPIVFASCPNLKKLSLSNIQFPQASSHENLEKIFESLVTCPSPHQLLVDLRSDKLTRPNVEKLLKTWKKMGEGKKLKMILLGGDVQEVVREMVLQN